jgi:hypothetical protein
MATSPKVYKTEMKQILKDKGFVLRTENGFSMYGIPNTPFSFRSCISPQTIESPKSIRIFNQIVEDALNYSNRYL